MSRPRRTYSHLEDLGRKPTAYEIASSRLLYYPDHGFEVVTPIAAWYERHQHKSRLQSTRWEEFRDPRETTYTRYVERQRDREVYVDGLLRALWSADRDAQLDKHRLRAIGRLIGPLRFPLHGLQMIAAYVGSMAPSGKLAIAFAFQAADQTRRVQRLAYRLRQLRELDPTLGDDARGIWERDAAWQPLRRVIERLLVTYDWGEAMVALDAVVQPMFDELFLVHGARLLAALGDDAMSKVFASLHDDAIWHRELTRAWWQLVREDNHAILTEWRDAWWRDTEGALNAFAPVLANAPGIDYAAASSWIAAEVLTFWKSLDAGKSP